MREEFRGIVDVQVVAFAQDGIVKEPGADRLMEEAMALGADVVGGIPWIEFTDDDARHAHRVLIRPRAKHDADVSMLLDDAGDPGLRTLEMLATETLGGAGSGARSRTTAAPWRSTRRPICSDCRASCARRRSPSSATRTPARCTRA